MTHDAKIASLSVQHESVRAPGHDPVLVSMKLAADQGVLRKGLIVGPNAADLGVPYDDFSEVLGTGDGSTKQFTGTLADFPLEPGSIAITDEVESFVDDGHGNLIGDAGGSGTIIYKTGAVDVSFDANTANDTDVTVTSKREIKGVLDRDVDTAVAADGAVIIHGTVKADLLLKGADTTQAAESADFKLLNQHTVYPI